MKDRKKFVSETMARLGPISPYERAVEFCNIVNKEKGPYDPAEYDCPECLNKGFRLEPMENGDRVNIPCRCMRIRESIWAAKASGMDELLRRCCFDNYRVHSAWSSELKKTSWNWSRQEGNAWMLLCGQSGCGKTHLAAAACNYRIFEGFQKVSFLTWREFNDGQYQGDDRREQERLLDKYMKAELLYIDDLLKLDESRKALPPWETELAFKLLNYRTNKDLPTIITTEHTPDSLLKIDEATASRILERAKGYTFTVEKDRKKNYRLRIA